MNRYKPNFTVVPDQRFVRSLVEFFSQFKGENRPAAPTLAETAIRKQAEKFERYRKAKLVRMARITGPCRRGDHAHCDSVEAEAFGFPPCSCECHELKEKAPDRGGARSRASGGSHERRG